MNNDTDLKLLERAVAQLGEHFDTVRIIATKYEDGKSWSCSYGNGNWYGQLGSVREWMTLRDEELRLAERRKGIDDHG